MLSPNIDAEIRSEISGGYKIKVTDIDNGIYVDGFRATQSAKNDGGWWIQPPAFKTSTGAWKRSPEYNMEDSVYWNAIERACVDAIEKDGTLYGDLDEFKPEQKRTLYHSD